MDPMDRFMDKVDMSEDGCWEWTAYKDPKGYGRFGYERRGWLAHKWLWEQHNGPVPKGLELDHLCKNTSCVRPDHLEAVTHQTNNKRAYGEFCKRGHSGDWYIQPDGRRRCRSCIREYNRTYSRKNPERDRANARERQKRYYQRKKAQRFES